MPGRFGGDYDQYEDEDFDDDDLDNLEEADEEDDEAEEDDEEEAEEEEEELEAEEKQQKDKEKKAKNRAIENRLKRIRLTAPYRFYPHLTLGERMFVNKARKTHPVQVARINAALLRQKEVFRMKLSSISPAIPYILIGVLILFLIIAVVAVIGSIVPSFFGDGSEEGGTASSQFGVNGQDFYGTRVVYEDKGKAQTEMIENYINILQNSIESIENDTFDINVELVEEDFDFSTFDETSFASSYPNNYQILLNMVDVVYNYDIANSDETADEQLPMLEKIDEIKYFGLNSELAVEISSTISSYINEHDLYTYESGAEGEGDDQVATIEQQITDGISNYFTANSFSRVEKYFIKDYIFDSADDMMQNIPVQDYVAMIFMPKNQVQFSKFSFIVSQTNLDTFNMYIQLDGQIVNFTASQLTSAEDGGGSNMYESPDDLNLTAQVYQNISLTDLNYLSEGMSLFDIFNGELDYNIYLKSITDQDEQIFTFKDDGVVTYFEADDDFLFVEFETVWD